MNAEAVGLGSYMQCNGCVLTRWPVQVSKMINNLTVAGVRFVMYACCSPLARDASFMCRCCCCYCCCVRRFSPRNYRGTKPLAQKMGLDTGWNSAISLQPLRNDGRCVEACVVDPGAMQFSLLRVPRLQPQRPWRRFHRLWR